MGFSRQEYWSGLPCPLPGDLPNPGIEPASLMSPALAGGFFTTIATWVALLIGYTPIQNKKSFKNDGQTVTEVTVSHDTVSKPERSVERDEQLQPSRRRSSLGPTSPKPIFLKSLGSIVTKGRPACLRRRHRDQPKVARNHTHKAISGSHPQIGVSSSQGKVSFDLGFLIAELSLQT